MYASLQNWAADLGLVYEPVFPCPERSTQQDDEKKALVVEMRQLERIAARVERFLGKGLIKDPELQKEACCLKLKLRGLRHDPKTLNQKDCKKYKNLIEEWKNLIEEWKKRTIAGQELPQRLFRRVSWASTASKKRWPPPLERACKTGSSGSGAPSTRDKRSRLERKGAFRVVGSGFGSTAISEADRDDKDMSPARKRRRTHAEKAGDSSSSRKQASKASSGRVLRRQRRLPRGPETPPLPDALY